MVKKYWFWKKRKEGKKNRVFDAALCIFIIGLVFGTLFFLISSDGLIDRARSWLASVVELTLVISSSEPPARVRINEIVDNTVPSVAANVTIINEGNVNFEYHYKYCVVDNINKQCGIDDNIDFAQDAKFILAGGSFTTDLNMTVSNPGIYWFKLLVEWGAERSLAIKQFEAIKEVVTPTGGGGGGGGEPTSPSDEPPSTTSGIVEISPDLGGSTVKTDPSGSRFQVFFPAAAVSIPALLTVTSVSKTALSPIGINLPAGLEIINPWIYSIKAEANGELIQTFLKPITLTFTYTDVQAQRFKEETFKIYRLDALTNQWVVLPDSKVDISRKTVAASINGFSLFAIMGEPVFVIKITPGDINRDGRVDLVDFSILLYNWGMPKNPQADFNEDGVVDLVDFSIMLYHWTG